MNNNVEDYSSFQQMLLFYVQYFHPIFIEDFDCKRDTENPSVMVKS